jgi:Pvc16 N-terminal domain/Carboxypeptidase regulatory-like domain
MGVAFLLVTLVVDVPLNTAIADLDEALGRLVKRELDKHGFEGVEIVFDAPSKEWAGKLTGPTVDVFLYDIREATERAEVSPSESRANGAARVTPPPLRLELTYAITAWTQVVEDEHRLLSQLLAILFSYRRLPPEALEGQGNGVSRLKDAETSVGRPREEKSDFWTSVGGQYKASIDLAVHIAIESGAATIRGPEVRRQTLRASLSERREGTMTEFHRVGGTLRDAAGEPVSDAWVALPDVGRWTASDQNGRFLFDRMPPGAHRVSARTASGDELETVVSVPGERLDLVLAAPAPARNRRSRRP